MIFRIPSDLVIGESAEFLPSAGEINWGMEAFAVEYLRGMTLGAGITAGITDTGVDRTHPLLTRISAAKDFTNSPSGTNDRNGHGSHTTSSVGASDPRIGVAPECKLVHAKVLSDSGSGGGQGIAAGMRWCAEQGAEIISMSLGSPSEDTYITNAMQELASKGIWIIAAAGNSGGGTSDVDWPGRSPYCISVAALDSRMQVASFSSAGDKIDTSGAGVNIWGCKPGGGFQQMSGTSMATPFVAGVLTLYRSLLKSLGRPIPSVGTLRDTLFSDSTDVGTPGKDRRTGPGWITPLLLASNLQLDPPPVRT